MNGFERLLDKIFAISFWDISKLAVLVFLLIYIIFSIVVIRQINLMSKALNGTLNLPLKIFAWLHFGLAVFVFLLSLLML